MDKKIKVGAANYDGSNNPERDKSWNDMSWNEQKTSDEMRWTELKFGHECPSAELNQDSWVLKTDINELFKPFKKKINFDRNKTFVEKLVGFWMKTNFTKKTCHFNGTY